MHTTTVGQVPKRSIVEEGGRDEAAVKKNQAKAEEIGEKTGRKFREWLFVKLSEGSNINIKMNHLYSSETTIRIPTTIFIYRNPWSKSKLNFEKDTVSFFGTF